MVWAQLCCIVKSVGEVKSGKMGRELCGFWFLVPFIVFVCVAGGLVWRDDITLVFKESCEDSFWMTSQQ